MTQPMDSAPRRLFWFVLRYFEKGDDPFKHKPMNRKILLAVGVLFGFLSAVSAYMALNSGVIGYSVPVIVFFIAAAVCLIVGLFGSDRAVAKIWGNN